MRGSSIRARASSNLNDFRAAQFFDADPSARLAKFVAHERSVARGFPRSSAYTESTPIGVRRKSLSIARPPLPLANILKQAEDIPPPRITFTATPRTPFCAADTRPPARCELLEFLFIALLDASVCFGRRGFVAVTSARAANSRARDPRGARAPDFQPQ